MTVEKVCSRDFLTIKEDEFGFEALRLMTLHKVPFLVVVSRTNAPVGYISRGDLIKAQRDKIEDDTIIEKGAWARLFGK
jgi:CBS domain-containing protein